MAAQGGQPGNQNAAKAKIWQSALKRALSRYSGESVDAGLDKLADKVVKAAADDGDQWAIMEIANRCDGRPAQSVSVGEDPEHPFGNYAGLGGLYPKPDPTEDGGTEGQSK